jgi:hypothetical protein
MLSICGGHEIERGIKMVDKMLMKNTFVIPAQETFLQRLSGDRQNQWLNATRDAAT